MEKTQRSRRGLKLCSAAPLTASLIILLLILDFYGANIVSFFQWSTRSQIEDQNTFKSLIARLVRGEDRRKLETTGYACDVTENSLVCVTNQGVRIETNKDIIVYTKNSGRDTSSMKPYALQKDKYLLQWITPVKILHGAKNPPACHYNHTVPAVIFSSGILGNIFHEFNDIIIPLFITTSHFKSEVLFILEDYDAWFVTKFSKILSRLSRYQVMNPAANATVHCFPGMILGLRYHDNLALNPRDIPGGYSMRDFRQFLAAAYSLKFAHVSQVIAKEPMVMLLSREKTRKFLNEDEIVSMIQGLGFRVVVARTKDALNLDKFGNMINSCAVLVGAHGAGLTNELFLPIGAVMVQVEPVGVEWAASKYYGDPAGAMGVQYLRYKIEPEESSLVELYGRNDSVITDPESFYGMGYRLARSVYLEQQDITVNVARFRKTMVQALELVTK